MSVFNGVYYKNSRAFQRRRKMIVTLLLSVPKPRITHLLRATFPSLDPADQEYDPTPPFAPYHLFVTSLTLQSRNNLYEGDFYNINRQPPRKLVEFVEERGLKDRYFAEAPLGRISDESDWGILIRAINIEHCRDLTWALCSHVEHIKALAIPLFDVGCYLSLVDRFETLRNVTFHLERQFSEEDADMDEITPEELKVLRQQQDEHTQHLDQMLIFVQGLRQRHRNVLQTASCYGVYPRNNEKCPEKYQEELARLLPPLLDPQDLRADNWAQFVTKVKETNLSAVKAIMPPQGCTGPLSLSRLLRQSPFLHRCRSLLKIHLTTIDNSIFQWAVEERKQYDAEIAAGRSPHQPLVPLEDVDVVSHRPSDGRLINDIGYGFGETLRTLNFQSYSFSGGEDLDSVECSLVNIIFKDRRQEYSISDITRWEPAELPQLESIRMRGSPAVSFNLETLRTTPALQNLELVMTPEEMHGFSFIPPVAELEELDGYEKSSMTVTTTTPSPRRLIWTWSWDLPILTTLVLAGEVAYRFQFRMLQGTPSLVHFSVDMSSTSGLHKRTIGIKDLLHNTPDSATMEGTLSNDDKHNDDLGLQSECIQLPLLKRLDLKGSWTLDTQVLETLCGMAPSVTDLWLLGCSGFSLVDWLHITSRRLLSLVNAGASGPLTAEFSASAGLNEVGFYGLEGGAAWYQYVQLPEGRTTDYKLNYYVHP
ncbi:hypothetical protein BGZ97_003091 [Linnemannia gamsii]|uniref:Uncharacterized protein n=1 Tax=Linnemannia gamsii TaxID=64522 RepID=A0A9P6QW72_9FUNG|nr:hypothetical protein BGZ97_003091 [Linnemannia gamsii]